LMDPRVLDVPYPIRFGIVYGCILPFRPRKSAEAYSKVWTELGSPLVSISATVQRELRARVGIPVELSMRYQNPTIESAIEKLLGAGVNEVLVAPLFAHHAKSSYESATERVKRVAARVAPELRLSFLAPYYDRPEYIKALAESAEPYLRQDHDHLLFSFHGLPHRHIRKANPECRKCLNRPDCSDSEDHERLCYRRHCLETLNRFTATAKNAGSAVSFSFQSRLGVDDWLEPNTHSEITRLAKSGVRKLMVICPAFAVDCLETLEEIGMRAKEEFLRAGGEEFTLIPCLNDHPVWLDGLAQMVSGVHATA